MLVVVVVVLVIIILLAKMGGVFSKKADIKAKIQNKVILITGASSGLGKEIALLCAENNAGKLIITGRDVPR